MSDSPTPFLDAYRSLVRERSTQRTPVTKVQRAAFAHSVARRLLIENHTAEFRRLYEGVLAEIPVPVEEPKAQTREASLAAEAASRAQAEALLAET